MWWPLRRVKRSGRILPSKSPPERRLRQVLKEITAFDHFCTLYKISSIDARANEIKTPLRKTECLMRQTGLYWNWQGSSEEI